MFDFIKNKTVFADKYKTHSEAIIISCFFNPQNSPYRIKAFNEFYDSIKHLNHSIVECVIGDAKPQLPENKNIKRVCTESLLWHKEALLNKIISELPKKYKYIFWVDADVIFTNKNWLIESVEQLKNGCNILQPFEYCVHLNKDELKPNFNIEEQRINCSGIHVRHKQMWRSFSSNYVKYRLYADSENYDVHGHVGFAWGARREILEAVPLYDKALIGGADHIICHAAAGQTNHSCIAKSFTDNLDEVIYWSRKFNSVVHGKLGYVKGDLFHIWHGDIDKRDYFNRIVDFTKKSKDITYKDKNGLYVTKDKESIQYMKKYFAKREVVGNNNNYIHDGNDGFFESMMYGYMTNSTMMGGVMGGNFAGAMLGDMLNDSENQQNNNVVNDNTEQQQNQNNDNVDNNNNNSDTTNINQDTNTDYSGSTFS